MRFWLIQFVSRSRTSSPPGDWLSFQQVLHQKPQICEREQGRNIKAFDWSIKVMIVRNIPNVIQNCYNCFLHAYFFVTTSWTLFLPNIISYRNFTSIEFVKCGKLIFWSLNWKFAREKHSLSAFQVDLFRFSESNFLVTIGLFFCNKICIENLRAV